MDIFRKTVDYIKSFEAHRKDFFSNARDEITRGNLLNLHRFSYVLLVLEVVFFLVYLQPLNEGGMFYFMAAMIGLELAMAIFISLDAERLEHKPELVHLLCLLQLLVIHALIVFLAVLPITATVIVYYPLIYAITPCLFILEIWENYIICALSSLSLCALTVAFSTGYVRSYNLSAALAAFILILFITFFVQDFRLRHYELQSRLRKMSSIDELTGIYNKSMTAYLCRAYYGNGINRRIPKSALMVIDVDEFKGVNDTYGHAEGDKVLAEVGRKMHGIFREDDIVGRIGGDEFIVLLKNTTDRNIIRMKAQQLYDAVTQIQITEGNCRPITCSVGIAVSPNNGNTYEELFSKADRAMYQGKKTGADKIRFYSSHPEKLQRPALLVVDDALVSREIVKGIFKEHFEVLEAANGQEAMNMLHDYHENIEIVILDLIMPLMDGYEVMKAMADDATLRAIPVVVATADASKELEALKMGAVDLVTKPFDPDVLRQRVENLLRL